MKKYRSASKYRPVLRALALSLSISILGADAVWALDPRQKLKKDNQLFEEMSADRPASTSSDISGSYEDMAVSEIEHQALLTEMSGVSGAGTETGAVETGSAEAEPGGVPLDEGEADVVYSWGEATQEVRSVLPVNALKPVVKTGWTVNTTSATLTNAVGGTPLEYNFTMAQAGSLVFGLNALATGSRALPDGYERFQIAVFIDGSRRGTIAVDADKNSYRAGQVRIDGLAAGARRLRLIWENDVADQAAVKKTSTSPAKPATGVQLTVRDLSFVQVVTKPAPDPSFALVSLPPSVTNRESITVRYHLDGEERERVIRLAEGLNAVVVEERDRFDRRVSAAFEVTRDSTPPSILILSTVSELTNDPALHIRYTSDGEERERTFTLIEGDNTVRIEEADRLGNVSTQSLSVRLDTIAPVITPLAAPPALTRESVWTLEYLEDGLLRRKTFGLEEGVNALRLEAVDAAGNRSVWEGSVTRDSIPPSLAFANEPPALTNRPEGEIAYTVDGREVVHAYSLHEGYNLVTVTEADAAGNIVSRSFAVTLDTVAPAIDLISAVPALTNRRDLSVRYQVDGVERTLDRELVEGLNTITIEETDAAGNRSRVILEITLDTAPPVLVVTGDVPALTNAPEVEIVYALDGTEVRRTVTLEEGENLLRFAHADEAGNETVLERTVTLDTAPPVLALAAAAPEWTREDRLTVAYMVDGEARSASFDLVEGFNRFVIEERDAAGNRSELVVTTRRDTAPPAVSAVAEPPAVTREDRVIVDLVIDGAAPVRREFALSEGVNVLKFSAADPAGNITVWERTVTRDSTPPVLGGFSAVPDATEYPELTIEYTVDGSPKQKTFGLELGDNDLTVTESDELGNASIRVFRVRRDPPSGIKLTAEPPAVTDAASVTLEYTIAGRQETKTFSLKLGENILTLTGIDALGDERQERVWITRTGQAPVAGDGFTLKTETDDVLVYQAGALTEVRTLSGTVLSNLRLDADGRIADAEARFADGSVQLLEDGQVVGVRHADGTKFFYRDGRLEKILAPDGALTRFERVGETIVAVSEASRAVYTDEGVILFHEDLAAGTLTRFVGGAARSVVLADGTEIAFEVTDLEDGGTRTRIPQDMSAASAAALPYREATHAADGRPLSVTLHDGTVVTFGAEAGVGIRVTRPDGSEAGLDWELGPAGSLVRAGLVQAALRSEYAGDGKLTSVDTGEMAIDYEDGRMTVVRLKDGTAIFDPEFDEDGDLTGGEVVEPDGTVKRYAGGAVAYVVAPDGTTTWFADGKPVEFKTPDEEIYRLTYDADGIRADLDPSFVPDLATPVRMRYDASMNLKEMLRADGQIRRYLDGRLIETALADGVTATYEYLTDAEGREITVAREGRLTTTYDASGQPVESVLQPGPEGGEAVRTLYRYGRIRSVQKGDAEILRYSYTFDADGRELTHIEDLEHGVRKTYADGLMLESLELATQVLSRHTYSEGRTAEVRLSRLGRELSVYRYAYSAEGGTELTHVTDPSGVERTYDASNRLTRLVHDGVTRTYEEMAADPDDASQGARVRETISRKALGDGAVSVYRDGLAQEVRVPLDGGEEVRVTGVTYGPSGNFETARYTDAGGVTRVFDASGVIETIRPDGARAFYHQGKMTRYVDPAGRTYEYGSAAPDGSRTVTVDGTRYEYGADGTLLRMRLDGVQTPEEAMAGREFSEGTGYGYYPFAAYDGDWSTQYFYSASGGDGGRTAYLVSEHRFEEPQSIAELAYRMSVSASTSGRYNRWRDARMMIEVEQDGVWTAIPETVWGAGSGGDGSIGLDTGEVRRAAALDGVTAIRAVAMAHSNCSGGECSYAVSASITELSYTLADSSALTADLSAVTSGGGIVFEGPKGRVVVDDPGLAALPYAGLLTPAIPDGFDAVRRKTLAAILTAEEVHLQEYTSDGKLEAQAKGDRTVTLYGDHGKPEMVLDQEGNAIIEYSYDADGDLERILLKKAREDLPKEIARAEADVEARRAEALRQLAESREHATGRIREVFDSERRMITDQLNSLTSGRDGFAGRDVSGKDARKAKAQALSGYDAAIGQAQGMMADAYRRESAELEKLDNAVQKASQEIAQATRTAVDALKAQEVSLRDHILLQEVTPVAFDAYRRILGRDPSTAEYQELVRGLDYATGEIILEREVERTNVPRPTVAFDGDGDHLVVDDPYRALTLGAGDWDVTTRLSFNDTAKNQTIWDIGGWRDGVKLAYQGTQNRLEWHVAGTEYGVWNFTAEAGRLYDLRLARENGMVRMYVDGALVREDANTSFISAHAGVRIGYSVDNWNHLNGSLAELLVRSAGRDVFHVLPEPEDEHVTDRASGLLIYTKHDAKVDPSRSYLARVGEREVPLTTRGLLGFLEEKLTASPERAEREAFVNALKADVTGRVTAYLAMSASERAAYAGGLGLAPSDLIALTGADASAILEWIQGGNLHFGQSAFNAMDLLLEEKGLSGDRIDIAARTVLIDILTGVITPLDEGDLVLSLYAMKKALIGRGYDAEAVRMDYDALNRLYDQTRVLTEEVVMVERSGAASVDFGAGQGLLTVKDPGRDMSFEDGDFTIESWVNLTGQNVMNTIAAKNTSSGWILYVRNNEIGLYNNWNGYKRVTVDMTPGQWRHVAVSRSGNTLRFFLDGKAVGTFGITGESYGGGDADVQIGAYNTSAGRFHGRMEELRVSREALYTADFAPSSVRTAAGASTMLLMRSTDASGGDWLKDLSARNRAITVSAPVSRVVDGAKTFTETIHRSTRVVRGPPDADLSRLTDYNPRIIAHIQGNHYVTLIDVTKTHVTYIDTSIGADGENEVVTVTREEFGRAWQGHLLADLTLLQRQDRLETKLDAYQELEAFYRAESVIIRETPVFVETDGAAWKFDGDDHLDLGASEDWTIGQGDFTVETWVRLDEAGREHTLINNGVYGSSYGWILSVTAQGWVQFSPGPGGWASMPSYAATSHTLGAHAWHHIAVQRSGNTLQIWINGQLATGYSTQIGGFSTAVNPLMVGKLMYPGPYNLKGALDGLRISKGVARYAQGFAPARTRFEADARTRLLLYASSNGVVVDHSGRGHTVSVQGAVLASADHAQKILTPTVLREIDRLPGGRDPGTLSESERLSILTDPFSVNPRKIITTRLGEEVSLLMLGADFAVFEDAQGVRHEVTKDEFIELMAPGAIETPKAYTVLSDQEAQSIRGAFFGNLLGILGTIFNFIPGMQPIGLALTLASSIVNAIQGDWMGAISSIMSFGLGGGFDQLFSGTFTGISNALSSVGGFFKDALGFLAKPVTGFLNLATDNLTKVLDFLPGVGLEAAQKAAQSAIGTGLNFAVSRGLETLGLPMELSGLLGQYAQGAYLGSKASLQDGSTKTTLDHIKSNVLEAGVRANGLKLGTSLGLSSQLTQTLSLGLGAITGDLAYAGTATGDLAQAFRNVMPSITQSLGVIGVDQLSAGLGLDPRLVGALALPLTGSITRSFSTGVFGSEDFLRSINDSVTAGALQAGINFAVDQMDLDDPLLEALSSAVLTSSIRSALDPNGNVFDELLTKAGEYATKVITSSSDPIFQTLVRQKGIIRALEDSATSIFTRGALEEIVREGGIAQVLSKRAELIDYDGLTLTKVSVTSTEGFLIDSQGQYVGAFRTVPSGVKEELFGEFSKAGNKLINGTIRQTYPTGEVAYLEVRDGKVYRLVLRQDGSSHQARVTTYACPDSETGCVRFDLSEGSQTTSWDWELVENYEGKLTINGLDVTDGLHFIRGEVILGVSDLYARSVGITLKGVVSPQGSTFTHQDDLDYLLLNGISYQSVPEGTPPPYFDPSIANSFVGSLEFESVARNKIDFVALYEGEHDNFFAKAVGIVGDVVNVVKSRFSETKEVADVRAAFDAMLTGGEKGFIPLGYSGGGQPLVKVLNETVNDVPKYNFVNTVIIVGAPVFEPITNTNVKSIVNIYGSEDEVDFLLGGIMRNQDFVGGRAGLTQYNIVLEGVNHTGYFFNPQDHDQKEQELNGLRDLLAELEQDIGRNANGIANVKAKIADIERIFYADAFVARLTAASADEFRLGQFIDQINPDRDVVASVNLHQWAEGANLTIDDAISIKLSKS